MIHYEGFPNTSPLFVFHQKVAQGGERKIEAYKQLWQTHISSP